MTPLLGALAIGVAFGWAIERAGLGDARKLSAQFFLRDFTVFKVMFTALVTAMLGSFWLDLAGVLDLSQVYLPDTFLVPQALGGAIFGAGIVVAGLCPGTSCVAAASGRLDGVAVMGGLVAGMALFNTAYPWLQPVVDATPMGALTLSQVAGVPHGWMVGAVALLALVSFALVNRFERTPS